MSIKKQLVLPAQIPLAHTPTPIHFLPRISEELGTEIYIKRDDFTGSEWGGNKIRKIEFLAADALEKKATCLVTFGGLQSNHCRATASVAAKLGLRCILVLRGENPAELRANFLLDKLFGAEIIFVSDEQYAAPMPIRAAIDAQLRAQGGKAYFIPEGGSNALGSLGYAKAWLEIQTQIAEKTTALQAPFSSLLVAHGSGGTQAGLLLGKLLYGESSMSAARVVGVNVAYDREKSYSIVKDILWAAIQQFHFPISFMADDIEILDGFVGLGYAKNTAEELDFFAKIASQEGLLLDPTYTGKAFYGLVQTLKSKPNAFGEKVLFLHTGGMIGNFKEGVNWAGVIKS